MSVTPPAAQEPRQPRPWFICNVRHKMKLTNFLPIQLRGLVELFLYHPFWHPRYRDDFGRPIVVLSAMFQLLFFAFLISRNPEMWLAWLFAAFLAGSLAALFACAELSIFRARPDAVRSLLIVQASGLGLVVTSLLLAGSSGSISSVADGFMLYPLVIGSMTFICAPLVIWEGTRR